MTPHPPPSFSQSQTEAEGATCKTMARRNTRHLHNKHTWKTACTCFSFIVCFLCSPIIPCFRFTPFNSPAAVHLFSVTLLHPGKTFFWAFLTPTPFPAFSFSCSIMQHGFFKVQTACPPSLYPPPPIPQGTFLSTEIAAAAHLHTTIPLTAVFRFTHRFVCFALLSHC